MNIIILLDSNPFYAASASANRWLTLIQGLNELDVNIQMLILGNYQTKKEKEICGKQYENDGIVIKYVNEKVLDTLWKRRYYNYIGKHIQKKRTSKKVKKEIVGFNGIVWAENDLNIWKMISNISKKSFKLISEMSEFLDIHHFNKGNALQTKASDLKQAYFENKYMQKLDGFILMTKTLISHYSNFSQHPPLLHLPMTVDLDRFKKQKNPPLEFKKPYIAFVGVMDDAKDGVNILIKAFYKISKDYPKLNLYLIGSWNYDTPAHIGLIKELKLVDRINWVGEYPRDTIPAIICNAKLLVLPRPDSKQAQGGFPTKLGEYLATGVPVCATTVGELEDYLTDNESVFFAKPGSIDSFANSINKALKDPVKANKIGKQGKNVAEKFFNKNIQSKILYNFLKQL